MEELSPDPLLRDVRRDFRIAAPHMAKLARAALDAEATRMPVFVAASQPVNLGLPAIKGEELGLKFDYRIAPLEQLVQVGLLDRDGALRLRQNAGDPFERAAILLVEPGGARFIFLPYSDGIEELLEG